MSHVEVSASIYKFLYTLLGVEFVGNTNIVLVQNVVTVYKGVVLCSYVY